MNTSTLFICASRSHWYL